VEGEKSPGFDYRGDGGVPAFTMLAHAGIAKSDGVTGLLPHPLFLRDESEMERIQNRPCQRPIQKIANVEGLKIERPHMAGKEFWALSFAFCISGEVAICETFIDLAPNSYVVGNFRTGPSCCAGRRRRF